MLGLFWLSSIGIGMVVALVIALLIAAAHQVTSAADLAALSAASKVVDGPGPACAAAARVAASMRAKVITCQVQGEDVLVELESIGVNLWGVRFPMRAQARAGPAVPAP